MAFSVLGTLGTILGLGHGAESLGAINLAGQAQVNQAVSAMVDNLKQNAAVNQSMTGASNEMVLQNAMTGKYSMQQNSAASTYQTQLQIANKWMTVLSGSQ